MCGKAHKLAECWWESFDALLLMWNLLFDNKLMNKHSHMCVYPTEVYKEEMNRDITRTPYTYILNLDRKKQIRLNVV